MPSIVAKAYPNTDSYCISQPSKTDGDGTGESLMELMCGRRVQDLNFACSNSTPLLMF
jgi:hypothetical protein